VEKELDAIVTLDPSRLTPQEIAVLEFARKIILAPADLTTDDFQSLRDQGLTDSDIVRIIAIAAWSVAETVAGSAFEDQPDMPQFTKSLQQGRGHGSQSYKS
jgi:uncharacterized protein YciW